MYAFIGTFTGFIWLVQWHEERTLPDWLELMLWPFLGFGLAFLVWSVVTVFRALWIVGRYLVRSIRSKKTPLERPPLAKVSPDAKRH